MDIEYNRIEGNTLTLQETAFVVNEGVTFIDGNGLTSRLLMNLYLLRNGYIITLKGSNDAKISYYMALEKLHTEHLPEDFQKLVIEAEIFALQKCLSIMP